MCVCAFLFLFLSVCPQPFRHKLGALFDQAVAGLSANDMAMFRCLVLPIFAVFAGPWRFVRLGPPQTELVDQVSASMALHGRGPRPKPQIVQPNGLSALEASIANAVAINGVAWERVRVELYRTFIGGSPRGRPATGANRNNLCLPKKGHACPSWNPSLLSIAHFGQTRNPRSSNEAQSRQTRNPFR